MTSTPPPGYENYWTIASAAGGGDPGPGVDRLSRRLLELAAGPELDSENPVLSWPGKVDDGECVHLLAILLALAAILITGALLFFVAAVMSVHAARRRYAAGLREAQTSRRRDS